ncbi:hypothetical protein ACNKHP_26035 [Shigella boydii]
MLLLMNILLKVAYNAATRQVDLQLAPGQTPPSDNLIAGLQHVNYLPDLNAGWLSSFVTAQPQIIDLPNQHTDIAPQIASSTTTIFQRFIKAFSC